jgi:hypothetical protein
MSILIATRTLATATHLVLRWSATGLGLGRAMTALLSAWWSIGSRVGTRCVALLGRWWVVGVLGMLLHHGRTHGLAMSGVEHGLARLLVHGPAVRGLGHASLTAEVGVGGVGGDESVGL